MKPRKPNFKQIHYVAIAYAANLQGDGVAYAEIAGENEPRRIAFRLERYPALLGREIGYAALIAVATALRAEGFRAVRLAIPDERVIEDLEQRRQLPQALALQYVQLKCRLNMFSRVDVIVANPSDDLCARARAEVELAIAA
ncbi:MAG TPA: hypothetical protein VGG22_13830 [Candidatus Baltobacteraceae bacterium]|jgi:hypothetical protein